jgi:hypothetical protein
VVLGLRGLAALLVLAGLVALARVSLLAKVVAAILAGVLATAVVAVGVIGTTVVRGYEREQAALVADAAVAGRSSCSRRSSPSAPTRPCSPTPAPAARLPARPCSASSDRRRTSRCSCARTPSSRSGAARALSPAEAIGLAGSELVVQARAADPTPSAAQSWGRRCAGGRRAGGRPRRRPAAGAADPHR